MIDFFLKSQSPDDGSLGSHRSAFCSWGIRCIFEINASCGVVGIAHALSSGGLGFDSRASDPGLMVSCNGYLELA